MKGLLVLSHNVEDVEALGTRALLRRAGLDVVTLTYEENLHILTSYGLTVKADAFMENITLENFDFVVIPGGPYVKETIDKDTMIQDLVRRFDEQGKLLAAICAGPRFLGRAGILDGKDYTAFTGSDKDAPKGNYHPEEKAIRDGNVITARGAGAIYEFAYEITKYLKDGKSADDLLEEILH